MKRSFFFFSSHYLSVYMTVWQEERMRANEVWKPSKTDRELSHFLFFPHIKWRMFAACILLFFLITPYPDFSFVYIIDIVTHTHTYKHSLLFLVLLIVLWNWLSLPYIYDWWNLFPFLLATNNMFKHTYFE
jgi:hypothetical protein